MFVADYVLMEYGTGAIMAVPRTTSATMPSRSLRPPDPAGRRATPRGDGEPPLAAGDDSCPTPATASSSTPTPTRRHGQPRGAREIVAWLDREARATHP